MHLLYTLAAGAVGLMVAAVIVIITNVPAQGQESEEQNPNAEKGENDFDQS